jgi:hypothetical protein
MVILTGERIAASRLEWAGHTGQPQNFHSTLQTLCQTQLRMRKNNTNAACFDWVENLKFIKILFSASMQNGPDSPAFGTR